MRAQTEAPINDAIVNWCSNERWSQCTYRCAVLPDKISPLIVDTAYRGSQCTYRCVVLPDPITPSRCSIRASCLNAPTGAWCSLTSSPRRRTVTAITGLNAPTGAWCSLTPTWTSPGPGTPTSQCTYRCVVLPDPALGSGGMTPLRGPGAPPAPGAPLRTGQHRAQSST